MVMAGRCDEDGGFRIGKYILLQLRMIFFPNPCLARQTNEVEQPRGLAVKLYAPER